MNKKLQTRNEKQETRNENEKQEMRINIRKIKIK